MRTTYVAGNWKMNMDREGTVALVKELVAQLKDCKNKVMIAPPFVYLDLVSQLVKGTNILLGAQNCAATDNGAHTGEISVAMLKDLGVQVVILGHSERRYEFGECDELINMKVTRALAAGLDVIICIGELLAQREVGRAEKVCERQLNSALMGVSKEQLSHVTIAYEPVWNRKNRNSRRRSANPFLCKKSNCKNVRSGSGRQYHNPVWRLNERKKL